MTEIYIIISKCEHLTKNCLCNYKCVLLGVQRCQYMLYIICTCGVCFVLVIKDLVSSWLVLIFHYFIMNYVHCNIWVEQYSHSLVQSGGEYLFLFLELLFERYYMYMRISYYTIKFSMNVLVKKYLKFWNHFKKLLINLNYSGTCDEGTPE
jgi:hypothetical protein